MLLVYSPSTTSRVQYIFNVIFNQLLGIKFEITNDADNFISYKGPKVSYCKQPLGDELFFASKEILFEKEIKDQSENLHISSWNDIPVFFTVQSRSEFPFDPYAAAFYLVVRYEEYLPHQKDIHDRYDPSQSIAFKGNFLRKPVVNIWAAKIKEALTMKYSGLKFNQRIFKFIPTFDIDTAYAHIGKGLLRTIGSYGRALFKLDFHTIAEKTKVLAGIEKDPYDTYDYQVDIVKKNNLTNIYFFLLGNYGGYDKNINPDYSFKFRSVIKSLAANTDVGIHPSYASNSDPKKLETEVRRLAELITRKVIRSRQHFLKLSFPGTYQKLTELGITADYTMGYPSEPGFRASVCTPYNFYDLEKEKETDLKLFPFAFMESTLRDYLKISPEAAIEQIRSLIDEVRNVNGTFITVWHNHSLSDKGEWTGWKKVFEEMISYAVNDHRENLK